MVSTSIKLDKYCKKEFIQFSLGCGTFSKGSLLGYDQYSDAQKQKHDMIVS